MWVSKGSGEPKRCGAPHSKKEARLEIGDEMGFNEWMRPNRAVFLCFTLLVAIVHVVSAMAPRPQPTEWSEAESRQGFALLYNLAGQQSELRDIFVIKHAGDEVKQIGHDISELNAEIHKALEKRFPGDTGVKKWGDGLPTAETQSRGFIQSVVTKRLMDRSGEEFETELMLTQTSALDYTSALLALLADVEKDNDFKKQLESWNKTVEKLQRRVRARF